MRHDVHRIFHGSDTDDGDSCNRLASRGASCEGTDSGAYPIEIASSWTEVQALSRRSDIAATSLAAASARRRQTKKRRRSRSDRRGPAFRFCCRVSLLPWLWRNDPMPKRRGAPRRCGESPFRKCDGLRPALEFPMVVLTCCCFGACGRDTRLG